MSATIELSQDGNMVCALLGPDLQEGIGGFGRIGWCWRF